uniref:Uncharacterized protein n=1 Tax=Anguilla anguilla TaxID=7936 RepID=A0A0E9UMA8_ANGAN
MNMVQIAQLRNHLDISSANNRTSTAHVLPI